MEVALTYLSHLGSHQASTPRLHASSYPKLHNSSPKRLDCFQTQGLCTCSTLRRQYLELSSLPGKSLLISHPPGVILLPASNLLFSPHAKLATLHSIITRYSP